MRIPIFLLVWLWIISGEQKGDISRSDAVIAEPKHYCVHGIAEGGTNCSHARAGRREVESCYLPVFEAGIVEGGAYNVMVSYNAVDGDPLMCSEWYLKDVLKERFAKSCEVIVAVCDDNTVTSGEGRDRCELTLAGRQQELIEKLAELGKPMILVLEYGKPLDISRESEICDAVIMAFFGGESGAKAIVEALFGEFSPAGRLPLSLPRSSTRIPCYYSMLPGGDMNFMEGRKDALYPFGFGLSYTKFAYSDLEIQKTGDYDVTVLVQFRTLAIWRGTKLCSCIWMMWIVLWLHHRCY